MAIRVVRLSSYSIDLDEADAKALYDMLISFKEIVDSGGRVITPKGMEVLEVLLHNLPE